jgi:quercetin dioxygenase-like cupin family protein
MNVKNVRELERFSEEKMAKVNIFESSRFFCDLYCLRPSQSQKVHSHAGNDKIYFVLRGQLKATVGGESCILREGEMVLAGAGEPHGVSNESSEPAVCLVFMAPHPGHS